MPKDHDQLVKEIIRYAGVHGVESMEKDLVEAALENLAVRRLLDETKISGWPKNGLISLMQVEACLKEAANQ